MSSAKQLAANRRNAQKSTGPKTPEGKANARFNAYKHGMFALSPLAPGDDPAAYDAFLAAQFDRYQPVGIDEEHCVSTLAVTAWRLRRAAAVEAGYYELGSNCPIEVSPAGRLSYGHDQFWRQLESLSRHEARLHKTHKDTLHELERLQQIRRERQLAEQSQSKTQAIEKASTSRAGRTRPETPLDPEKPLSPSERRKTLAYIDQIFSSIPKKS